MKCPRDRGILKKITVYGETYLMCNDCREEGKKRYFTPEMEEIEDILEYKNEIRRRAFTKLLEIENKKQEQEQKKTSEG